MEEPAKLAYFTSEPMFDYDETLCPLIFVHGFGHAKEMWHDIPQIAADETRRKAYAIDLRNVGDSEWTEERSQESNLKDLLHFMDIKKIKKAGLIGHSAGGYICQKFALKWPERVEFVIVEDQFSSKALGVGIEVEMGLSYYRHWLGAIRSVPPYMNKTDAIKYAVDYLYHQLPPEKHYLLSDKNRLCQYDYNLKLKDDGTYDLKDNVEVILKISKEDEGLCSLTGIYNGPIYFINGTASWYKVHEHTDEILEMFPKAEVFNIEGATHNVHIDAPEEFTNIMLKCILKHQDQLNSLL